MKRTLSLLPSLLVCGLLSAQSVNDWVNPFIGTTNFGACNPGAATPNGMMSVSPFNVMGSDLNTWDKDSRWWSTPYVFENAYFTGYSHVNLSGVGCPDLGSVLTMPTTGPLQVDYHLYGSEYTDEKARPGYYGNLLLSGIRTEVTATTRTSLERYTFPGGEGNILVNLGEGLTNESGATVRRVSDTEIEGSKLLGTFCYNGQAVFPLYFVLRVSKAPDRAGFWKKQRPMTAEAAWDSDAGKYKLYTSYARELSGDDIGCWFHYDSLAEGEAVLVQVGVSFVSVDNARKNLDTEQEGFDFEKYYWESAKALEWNDETYVFYTRFFDISIVYDWEEIQPETPVEVTIQLSDITSETLKGQAASEALQVVHFHETDSWIEGTEIENQATPDDRGCGVKFETEGFSVFGISGVASKLSEWYSNYMQVGVFGLSQLLGARFSEITLTGVENGLEDRKSVV